MPVHPEPIYYVVATLASHGAISSTNKGGGCKDDGQKPKDRQGRQRSGGKPPQKASINTMTQQVATGLQQHQQMHSRLGVSVCKEVHTLEKCEQFKKYVP